MFKIFCRKRKKKKNFAVCDNVSNLLFCLNCALLVVLGPGPDVFGPEPGVFEGS